FGGAILVADRLGRFPEDINVAWPRALLFYPAMGFVAEVVFHLIPLSLFSPLVRMLTNWDKGQRSYIIVSIAAVALAEAAFQVFTGGSGDRNRWLSAYLGLHLLGFGGAQLAVLRKRGFASMALMRLVYYAIWHILWGRLRLTLLF
ncbi:MAG: hypothetical protein OEY62_02735, partial [Acidimicrobiia bacterium]|nr:hypothetical protein [Acidimicrobiia bacterium]